MPEPPGHRSGKQARKSAVALAIGLGLTVGVLQSADFVRERIAIPLDPELANTLMTALILTTILAWTLVGVRARTPLRGALAGMLSSAVTTLTLWATIALVRNAPAGTLVSYALVHAAIFTGFGLACGTAGGVIGALTARRRSAQAPIA